MWWTVRQTLEIHSEAGLSGGKNMARSHSRAFPFYLKKCLQHGSKGHRNIFADDDLNRPEDLHQQIRRARDIWGSLRWLSGWWRSKGKGCQIWQASMVSQITTATFDSSTAETMNDPMMQTVEWTEAQQEIKMRWVEISQLESTE